MNETTNEKLGKLVKEWIDLTQENSETYSPTFSLIEKELIDNSLIATPPL